ncbi:MAG: Xcc1710-like domain-containing protein [Gammaproteobacteria bacterium]|nr:Xcc1710-like domain-containing protein [Gammaproteobacteria bacterium]NIR82850.1 Xcc1710-like domain-containing protein [Gammaproteobacteria bacterium]NIR89959.1 Xcc1710-like domain-containing protein [Gammaproteobacteria bacterium]NIU04008.1 Xcc1710-like domain-containing protein [Gammaproteobacteria bacterium]NIV51328.1 hypothetical protein [Gammaproteobacteria bacterium]
MKLHLDAGTATYRVSAYGPGYITVNEERHTRSIIIMPERLVRDWPPQSYEELSTPHLNALLEHRPEIVLLGTGARQHFPHASLIAPLYEQGIGLEVMDTAAACRTYNILMAEDRRVLAGLLMIER